MQQITSISTEAIRGATSLVELLHQLSDTEDDQLLPLAAAVRNVIWAQRDLVKSALHRAVEPTQ
jgi:hypothetical protein